MTKKLFFMLTVLGMALSSCSKKHEFIKNKTEVLSEKELRGMGKYTAFCPLTNEVYHHSNDVEEDNTNKCEFDFYRPEELNGKLLGIHQLIFLHQVKQFFQKYWIGLLLIVCLFVGGIAYVVQQKNRIEEEKNKATKNFK